MQRYSRQLGYSGQLAKKKRQVFILRIVGIFLIVIIFVLGLSYLALFSPYIKIKDINLAGNQTIPSETIYSEIEKLRSRKIFGVFDVYQNYLFFDTDELKASILEKFPVIKSIDVKKPQYNSYIFEITERKPVGTWCFDGSGTEVCRFFDEEGGVWGESSKSQGSIFLSVVEEAGIIPEDHNINEKFFYIFKILISDLTGSARPLSIIFMANGLGDIRVNTAGGFYILFNEVDIEKQLRDLNAFLAEKGDDPSFNPEYLDLRVGGRVYFR